MKYYKKRAFTLVELLVVISIIAMLMGVLMPALKGARQQAKRVACKAVLRGLANSVLMYLQDNRDYLPSAASLPSFEGNTNPPITEFLGPYVDTPEAFKCPRERKINGRSQTYFETDGTSYGYNVRLGGQKVNKNFLAKRFGEEEVHVMYDYGPFHGKKGENGSVNYLYGDGHVGDLENKL